MMCGATLMSSQMAWKGKYACIYKSFRAFHCHWLFLCCPTNAAGWTEFISGLSVHLTAHVCEPLAAWKSNKPLITALNTGVENWASLQPNPRLQVQDTACCVFLFRSLTCTDARAHVCTRTCVSDREKEEKVCVGTRASPDHTLWRQRCSALGFGHRHTVPLLVGWKLYIPHQSCHSYIIHTPVTQTHTFSSLASCHLYPYI